MHNSEIKIIILHWSRPHLWRVRACFSCEHLKDENVPTVRTCLWRLVCRKCLFVTFMIRHFWTISCLGVLQRTKGLFLQQCDIFDVTIQDTVTRISPTRVAIVVNLPTVQTLLQKCKMCITTVKGRGIWRQWVTRAVVFSSDVTRDGGMKTNAPQQIWIFTTVLGAQ